MCLHMLVCVCSCSLNIYVYMYIYIYSTELVCLVCVDNGVKNGVEGMG